MNTVGTLRPVAGFDQTASLSGSTGRSQNPSIMDVGYQNQLLNGRSISNLANQMNHMILFQFIINL
jgi:hypothetical protein